METTISVIRRMTRLAVEHGAVNLAQGFTDEAPAYPMVWAAVTALLGGDDAGIHRLERTTLGDLVAGPGGASASLEDALREAQNPQDCLS